MQPLSGIHVKQHNSQQQLVDALEACVPDLILFLSIQARAKHLPKGLPCPLPTLHSLTLQAYKHSSNCHSVLTKTGRPPDFLTCLSREQSAGADRVRRLDVSAPKLYLPLPVAARS